MDRVTWAAQMTCKEYLTEANEESNLIKLTRKHTHLGHMRRGGLGNILTMGKIIRREAGERQSNVMSH